MQTMDLWSVPERHMVSYQISRTVWWSIACAVAVLVSAATVLVLNAIGMSAAGGASSALWVVALVVPVAAAAGSFAAKESLLNRVEDDWTPYLVLKHYRIASVVASSLCLAGGLSPCAVALYVGQAGYELLAIVAPVGAMALHYPSAENVALLVEDVLHRPA